MNYRTSLFMLALTTLCVGCATTTNRPVNELATARASITLAEQNGAQQHSLEDLTKARSKLSRADNLANDGEYDAATRLANEAVVDARVAAAQAALRKNQQAAAELDETLKTLESELDRNLRRDRQE